MQAVVGDGGDVGAIAPTYFPKHPDTGITGEGLSGFVLHMSAMDQLELNLKTDRAITSYLE